MGQQEDMPELEGLRVNVTINGMALGDAKRFLESYFGDVDWPPAQAGQVEAVLSDGIRVKIAVAD